MLSHYLRCCSKERWSWLKNSIAHAGHSFSGLLTATLWITGWCSEGFLVEYFMWSKDLQRDELHTNRWWLAPVRVTGLLIYLLRCSQTCRSQDSTTGTIILCSASTGVVTISGTFLHCSDSLVLNHGPWQKNYKWGVCKGGSRLVPDLGAKQHSCEHATQALLMWWVVCVLGVMCEDRSWHLFFKL